MPGALHCASCLQLIHSAELESLAAEARQSESRGETAASRDLWMRALTLLPPLTAQYKAIDGHLGHLDELLKGEHQKREEHSVRARWTKALGPLGVAAFALWKFKALVLVALSKGKFLLMGLSKLGTLGSMLASIGVYWGIYGWQLAVGFILCIYVHEMGHVWMLRHFRLPASAPMFIPGLGAIVSLYQSPKNHGQDARIGLAGPVWGTAAALFCYACGKALASPLWLSIAHLTAALNLFNLVPVWQLDGGRGFRALTANDRWMILALALVLWGATGQGLFFLILLGGAYRLYRRDPAPAHDRPVVVEFALLLVVLGALSSSPLPDRVESKAAALSSTSARAN